jgi:phosphatidylglycerophosphate synthase
VKQPWALVLTRAKGAPVRRVGGLPLALRLALDAQRAGATAVVCAPTEDVPKHVLNDARLKIPVLDTPPPGTREVRVSASLLCHRDVFGAVGQTAVSIVTPESAPKPTTAYAFDPVDVVDAPSAGRAERLLFQSLRKPQDGWTSTRLNRHISLALSRLLVRTKLAPNQVSVGILSIGLLGAVFASRGTYLTMLVGAFLFQMQSVLDGCDGEMSRVTYRGSHLGEWLDTIGDDLTNYGFFAGAALGLHTRTGSPVYLAAGGVIVGTGVVVSFIEYRYLIKIGSGDLLKYPTSQIASEGGGVLSAIAPLFKRDTFVFLTLVAAVFDLVGPMLIVFAIGGVGIFVNVLMAEMKMRRHPPRRRDPDS